MKPSQPQPSAYALPRGRFQSNRGTFCLSMVWAEPSISPVQSILFLPAAAALSFTNYCVVYL